jgi:hypothetical protein
MACLDWIEVDSYVIPPRLFTFLLLLYSLLLVVRFGFGACVRACV